MIETKGLTKRYGDRLALDSLDLSVAAGEIYALLGANGAGKSTTIHLLLGFLRPDAGSASIDGIDPAIEPTAARRRSAYIPEQLALHPHLTGIESLDFMTRLAGKTTSRDDLERLFDEVGLAKSARNARVATYSKGMRQKVGIAIALAKGARALLLDEPTSGLDPAAANDFSRLVVRLAASGVAVLMATHDLFRSRETAQRAGILREGRLLRELTMRDLSAQELEAVYLEEVGGRPAESPRNPEAS